MVRVFIRVLLVVMRPRKLVEDTTKGLFYRDQERDNLAAAPTSHKPASSIPTCPPRGQHRRHRG